MTWTDIAKLLAAALGFFIMALLLIEWAVKRRKNGRKQQGD